MLLVLVVAAIALTRVGWRGDKPPPEDIDEPLAAPAEGVDPDGLPGGADVITVERR